jgi:hypothetical protein
MTDQAELGALDRLIERAGFAVQSWRRQPQNPGRDDWLRYWEIREQALKDARAVFTPEPSHD